MSNRSRCSVQTILLPHEQGRSIRAENATWDELVVLDLKTLALRALIERWQNSPIVDELPTTIDRDVLLEILPTDLPFELVIEKIPYEYYWSRAAKDRWEYNNPAEHGNSWRRLYCERHFSEYLETMENIEFRKEECNTLIKLVQPYIHTLIIHSLIPSKYLFKWSGDDDDDQCTVNEFPVHHIPFNVILSQLPELREIRLNFGVIYMNDGFEWRDFEFSVEDCLNLGRGIKNSLKMEKICLTRSNLDQSRVAALLQGVVINNNIQELDLSYCKLSDTGAHAIGEFLKIHKHIRAIYLINNGIGSNGVAGIVHGLLHESDTSLQFLNLRLNPIQDEGGAHICSLLLRNSSLKNLNISGCGLGTETGMGIAEVMSSGYMKISSLQLDISNNDFGPIAGEAFDTALNICTCIIGLDMRMCNFSKDSEYSISKSIARNKAEWTRVKMGPEVLARGSSLFIPTQVKSLLPPSGFESFQRPSHYSLDVQNVPVSFSSEMQMTSNK
ncbi:hypothetical protein PV327_001683 [Microctonus hyperodae]|uniref:T-complex-associated testis-expressed protein 1 n=1 Tax=Microctonus hyperodae TaxID=165561 RepID=A0AA39FED0_MICHY|nr:hypothetical protein PV327_001683 [Microctonus hyperodae]